MLEIVSSFPSFSLKFMFTDMCHWLMILFVVDVRDELCVELNIIFNK